MLRKVVRWIEERTGVESAVQRFLREDIPHSAGWHQVLGSVALFGFLTQVVTGILLAFNYAATPGDAYSSLRYIVTELTAGRMIRGMHHWGASLMIIVVVLHMARTFVWGAYKKPREATWIIGCVLLLVTLAYGLTGYLLPWDNRAYWGTVVTTRIASQAPGAGPYLLRLLGSEGGAIGVVTFSRFYAVHVVLLPPLTILLMAVHLYLVRRHGVTPTAADHHLPKKTFFPEQVFKDTLATFVWFCVLVGMAVAARVPLGHIADPTDASFTPRPEWYFLFLFQALKLFQGPLEIVGSIVLPTLAILTLFLVPFIDRGKVVRLRQRMGAAAVVVLSAITWGGLTARAVATTPSVQETDMSLVQSWQEIPPDELAAVGYFREGGCESCHPIGRAGAGPDLMVVASGKPPAKLLEHFATAKLKPAQMKTLASFFSQRSDKAVEAWANAPQSAVDGAMLFDANRCAECHKLNGAGADVGPELNGLAERRPREWVERHFADPAKLSPDTIMPSFVFNAQDMDRITSYLLQIPKE